MLPASAGTESVKQQVVDDVPKIIKAIEFGLFSNQDVVKQAVVEVADRELYVIGNDRVPRPNGALDKRMGISDKSGICNTCGETIIQCNGHFGHVRLALPAFHIGYLRMVLTILQSICKDCARILLPENDCRSFRLDLRRPHLDGLRRTQIWKKIHAECRKARKCPHCGATNGTVKKVGVLKLIHDKYRAYNTSTAIKKQPPHSKVLFDLSFAEAKKGNADVDKFFKRAADDLNPLRVLNLFRQMISTDCELLGMDPTKGRPEMFLWQVVPAPPVCIRPSVTQELATTEDDLTTKLGEIVLVSGLIRTGLRKGVPVQRIIEQWDYLQVSLASYVNSDAPGLHQASSARPIRGFCQRLKGKQGRFRGNLSGKRVDFSGRTVISPDPNLSINQVAIPVQVAKTLTYPEMVSRYNLKKLQGRILNGPNKWPGANYLTKKQHNFKVFLKYAHASKVADQLQVGDIVERHLEDGDIVLFNRQPSLHKLSILSHRVKVRPWRTFRLNECVCTPYNADFDGDEMNLHVPQTEEARTEAIQLMGVENNLATPKNGEPIVAAIQDFITGAYLLSSKDTFYDRKSFAQICMFMVDGATQVDLPPPTIIKPQALWTGKQVFNVLMRPNRDSPVLVNLDTPCREYKVVKGQPRDLDANDGWLVIRNSEVMCGVMDKSAIGAGKKGSVFYVILRDHGPDAAMHAMNRLAKLSARWLSERGFSIGINDVYPGDQLVKLKQKLVHNAYDQCGDVIKRYRRGELKRSTGCDEEQTMENTISGILSKVRQQAGEHCIRELSRWNSALIMATCGSKGSNINVSQMVAVVGQQIIGGSRVPDGFQDRSLPHFPKNARTPPSKGFVRNSFFSGLTPTEFLFHAISGREGLVDTAVKTAETGYMSRRLMKSLEDLSSQYDDTVRNSSSGVIQFQYGDDKLDPVDMEAKAQPVHFDRTFNHAEAITRDENDQGLSPEEVRQQCDALLAPKIAELQRRDLQGNLLAYDDRSHAGVDQYESARDFLTSIREFVSSKASQIEAIQLKRGLRDKDDKSQDTQSAASGKNEITAEDNDLGDETQERMQALRSVDLIAKLSQRTLKTFVELCLTKYKRAQVEPGHAVGAVGAQSIGEPGTQMTLKTFHFAGVAGMSITQGVPRIKEIINASKLISTPVISCELVTKKDLSSARVVKNRVQKIYLGDIIRYIEDVWSQHTNYLMMRVDFAAIKKMQLELRVADIKKAIVGQRKLKMSVNDVDIVKGRFIRVRVHEISPIRGKKDKQEVFERMTHLKRALPSILVRGHADAQRAIIKTDERTEENSLLVEGYGLKACMATDGVVAERTRTNSVMEMRDVLGIEAARKTIIDEISSVLGDMDIDPRHMQLLADVMTFKGEVLGITRFGLAKMRDSVLQLASFEKTPDHLFEAASYMKTDDIEGVSERIIMGQSIHVGTGAFQVVRRLGLLQHPDLSKGETVFEDCWLELLVARRQQSK